MRDYLPYIVVGLGAGSVYAIAAMGLVVTGNPTPNWRMRFLISHLDGKISKTVSYKQLYNDQFYVTGALKNSLDSQRRLPNRQPTRPQRGASVKFAVRMTKY